MIRGLTGLAAALALALPVAPAFAQQQSEETEGLYEETQQAEDAAGDVVEETRTGMERSAEEAQQSIDEDLEEAERELDEEVQETRTPEQQEDEAMLEGTGEEIEDTASGVGDDIREAIVPTGERAEMAQPKELSLEAGLGFSNFTGRLGDSYKTGAGWNIRAAYKADSLIGAELGYFGSANPREDSLEPGDWGFMNGLDLGARISWQNDTIFRPFVAGGAGISFMNTFFETSLDLIGGEEADDTWMLHFPVGVGVNSYPGENLMVGLRYDYRFQTNIIDNDIPFGNNWQLVLSAGATF